MNLNIAHYPNQTFVLANCLSPFTVDINQSVRKQLKGQQLTNAIALKILKRIKLKSDVLSFFTKPVVLISLSAAALIGGFLIPSTGIALIAAGIILCALAGGILGYSISTTINKFLPQLSQAYADQSKKAAEYIQAIKASNQEIAFTFV